MKKIYIFFLVVAAFILTSAPAWAESANAKADVTASANLTYAPQSYYEAQQDKRFQMNVPYGVHLINPSQAPDAPKGWQTVLDPALEKTLNRIDLGQPSMKFFKSWEDPIVFAHYSQRIPGVKFLKAVPADRFEMGEYKLRGADIVGDGQPIFLAIQRLKHETGTKWFYVLKNHTGKAKNAGVSLGSGGIFGKAVGPAKDVDKTMVALSAGGILGKSSAWVDEPCNVWVRAYSKAEEKPKYAGAPIFFEFNKAEIIEKIVVTDVETSNLAAVKKTSSWIADNIAKLKEEKKYVIFFGYCDVRGPEQYNDWLGNERAKSVMLEVAKLLRKQGLAKNLQGLMMFASAGKRQPQFKNHDMNRRVDVVVGQYLTTPPNQLPPIAPEKKEKKNEK